jgi:hypothetical protein
LEPPHADQSKEVDNAILETFKEISGTLGVTREPPLAIVWTAIINNAIDWPAFTIHGELALWPQLREKFSPAEWRPLLASSLVYETRFRGRERLLRAYYVSSFLISILITIVSFILILRYGPPPSAPGNTGIGRGLAGLTILLFFAVFFLLIAIPAPYFRRLRLKADRLTFEQFGTQQDLLTVLKKIQGMSIRPLWRISKLTTMEPTISRRILNISKMEQIG